MNLKNEMHMELYTHFRLRNISILYFFEVGGNVGSSEKGPNAGTSTSMGSIVVETREMCPRLAFSL